MSLKHAPLIALGLVGALLLAGLPLLASGYVLALAISMLSFTALATAWSLFCGPTHYISLASAAFFGLGAYMAAIFAEQVPWVIVLFIAAGAGLAVALVVGLSTLRLSGVYFAIFTFGLAELVRQLVVWYEVNIKGTMGRYLFLDMSQAAIYWQLLALTAATLAVSWLVGRSRLGLAARVIGDDEVVARHSGIDTTRVKVVLFALSCAIMALTGAIMAPRWTYIDPAIAFNPMISFQVVIMALLGGAGALFGPALGAIPLVVLFELLTANFPNAFSVLLGIAFIVIVYGLPRGVIGLLHDWSPRRERPRLATPAPFASQTSILAVDGLHKSFGGLRAVDDVSFRVELGEIVGLIGPNGSGKTTVLNLISGALRPDAGQIRFEGRSIDKAQPYRIAMGGIARTFQLVRVLPSMSLRDNISPSLAFRAIPATGCSADVATDRLLQRVGLHHCSETRAAELTYIDQKRLELARALALQPKLLLLDEWLAGLNPTELEEGISLIQSLRHDGVSIVMVEHVMHAIRALCDRCVVMSAGRVIAAGVPHHALCEPEVVRAYLGEADA
ncbi:MAG TPA: branched-chain amino acid ABC transporter ATP-binding protein/permease [Hyphomicrobiaceae bacterium]|nr:branched-chain amino acid ABC transporter ATP-binding protein/permease [Hyphomicrobiaceae bacterium]